MTLLQIHLVSLVVAGVAICVCLKLTKSSKHRRPKNELLVVGSIFVIGFAGFVGFLFEQFVPTSWFSEPEKTKSFAKHFIEAGIICSFICLMNLKPEDHS